MYSAHVKRISCDKMYLDYPGIMHVISHAKTLTKQCMYGTHAKYMILFTIFAYGVSGIS